jgi:hypothetical protein
MKHIEIRCFSPDGVETRMNRFPHEHDAERRKQQVMRAIKMTYDWSMVYPHDKFRVVEV